ncbi:NOP protein chaperone 1 [Aplochiton taeniatus]
MDVELNNKKTNSQDLLACGHGLGLHDKLLLKPKAASSFQTQRVPRSSVLDRLQSFLPQMALANEKLMQQIEQAPAGHYNIECVEETEKVIEMDVALVELSGSDSDSEEDSTQDGDDSDSEEESAVTVENLKLPGQQKKKFNIEVLDKQKN